MEDITTALAIVICSHCDRGNIYCGSLCARGSRAQNHRAANQRYQATSKGRRNHALRQRRYQERQKQKVTEQGSPPLPRRDVLPHEPNELKVRQKEEPLCCHYCGALVIYLRHGFLRDDFNEHRPQKNSSWPLGP